MWKLMKIFETAWLIIAFLAVGLFLYRVLFDNEQPVYYIYLIMVAILAIIMFVIKKKNRKYLEKKQKEYLSNPPR